MRKSCDENKYPRIASIFCLLMIYIGEARDPSVRYAFVHDNGRRRYRARGSKLKLKRIHRESFPVSCGIRSAHASESLCIYRFVRSNVSVAPSPGKTWLLSCGSSRPVFFALADLPRTSIYGFLIKQPSLRFIKIG